MNRPSEIVAMYRVASKCAARIGQEYVLDERRLEPMFTQQQIDAIFAEIEYIERMEKQFEARLATLDALPNLPQSDGAGENQPEQRTGPHRASGETNSGVTGDSELTRSARLPSDTYSLTSKQSNSEQSG